MSDPTSSEITPEVTPEVTPEITPEITPEPAEPPKQIAPEEIAPEEITPPPPREAPMLKHEVWQALQERFIARGEVVMPCVPAMLHNCLDRIAGIFQSIGAKVDSDVVSQIPRNLAIKLQEGFETSVHSRVRFHYEPKEAPEEGLSFRLNIEVSNIAHQYKSWLENREPPLFGTHPDAKLMKVAASLGEPSQVPVLDVGAGTGRNTIPLAQAGYPVDAVELTPEFVEQIKSQAEKSGLKVGVLLGDILKEREVRLRPAHYRLVVLAEVVASHFNSVDRLRLLLAKMSDSLQSGGLLLLSMFLTVDDYQPDDLARQLSQVNWSCLFTRQDLAAAMEKLPLELVSDESVVEYEKQHLPMEAWPPTGWFVRWCEGNNLFFIKDEDSRSPMELRWVLLRRV
jgi:2-polyprenyl-3-methyl-5-hydroxy-6-metoxy-1,4-benzoquinol methylase